MYKYNFHFRSRSSILLLTEIARSHLIPLRTTVSKSVNYYELGLMTLMYKRMQQFLYITSRHKQLQVHRRWVATSHTLHQSIVINLSYVFTYAVLSVSMRFYIYCIISHNTITFSLRIVPHLIFPTNNLNNFISFI